MIAYFFLMVILVHSTVFVCVIKNFSTTVETLGFISLPYVVSKYLCWCMWAVMRGAPGFLILSHMVFASGLIIEIDLENSRWEVS